jgi:SET domain-containing protein
MRRLRLSGSMIHGSGVFAATDLPAGLKLIEYKGRRLTHRAADRRYGGSADTGHTFLFTLNQRYVIDANQDGNAARWINHSCAPNCQAVVLETEPNGTQRDRVFIESLHPIAAGEELTYDYGIVLAQTHTPRLKRLWACRCGATGCSGTLLRPKRGKAKAP